MYTLMMAAVLLMAPFLRGNTRKREYYIWISCFLMFAVCGLRDVYSIGVDSASSYIRIFRECGEPTWEQLHETTKSNFGSAAFMKLIYDVTGGDYQTYIMVYTGFVMAVFARFVEKYSINPVESFAYFWGLLCYIFLFDALKQGMAMAFVTLAFDMIVDRKPVKFVLLVYIAFMFHAPALIFLPAYWIARMRVGKEYLLMLAGILTFTFLFKRQILEIMLQFYGTDIHDTGRGFFATKVVIMIVIVVAAMVLRPPNHKKDRVYNILLQFMGIAVVLQTFTSYNNTFERLANYYFQFAVVFIPMVFQKDIFRSRSLSKTQEASVKVYGPWIFGAFGVWRFANYIQSTSWIWLPFRFYFQR